MARPLAGVARNALARELLPPVLTALMGRLRSWGVTLTVPLAACCASAVSMAPGESVAA